MNIVRFVDPETACRILGKNSSYLLRSLNYYRELERFQGDIEVGDNHENAPTIVEIGQTKYYTRLGQCLVSCWSYLDSGFLQKNEWSNLSTYFNGVAILSTVARVEVLLSDIADFILGKCWSLEHRKVEYYKENGYPDGLNGIDAPFYKRIRYQGQKEYRFALYNPFDAGNDNKHLYINSLFLSIENPSNYIDSIYLSPDLDTNDKTRIVNSAYLGRNSKLIINE